jgi:hypothetical protein
MDWQRLKDDVAVHLLEAATLRRGNSDAQRLAGTVWMKIQITHFKRHEFSAARERPVY